MAPRLFAANTVSTNHGWFRVSVATRWPSAIPRAARPAASRKDRSESSDQVVVSPRYRRAGLSGRVIACVAACAIQWCRKDEAGAEAVDMAILRCRNGTGREASMHAKVPVENP